MTIQSSCRPGDDSNNAAVPYGNHLDANHAPTTPSTDPSSPVIAGAAAAVRVVCHGVMPSARSVCSSPVLAAAYRVIA
jgi:hypothetical protein